MVRADNISFSYQGNGQTLKILNNISFHLQRGGVLCIIGPSGCGKTTLLFNIAGLRLPDSGMIYVDDIPVTRPREKTGIIFQHFGLLPWMNVFENVALGLTIRDVPGKKIKERVELNMEYLGISHLAVKYPKHLSGGEKQRAAIARALVMRPDLLLLDEPFSSIDALTRESLQEFLLKAWMEWRFTIIHVTHDIEEAVFLGTDIIVLGRDGSIRKHYKIPVEKGIAFRDSPAFYEASSSLREHMKEIINESAR
jgi:NitT/TauT family transport system ATP-binding protein